MKAKKGRESQAVPTVILLSFWRVNVWTPFFVPVNSIRLLIFGTEQVKRTKFHRFFNGSGFIM